MTKEEILAKSREENKYEDLPEKEIQKSAFLASKWCIAAVAVVLLLLCIIMDRFEESHIIMSMIWALDFGEALYAAIRHRTKKSLWLSSALFLGLLIWDFVLAVRYLKG